MCALRSDENRTRPCLELRPDADFQVPLITDPTPQAAENHIGDLATCTVADNRLQSVRLKLLPQAAILFPDGVRCPR